MDKKTKLEEEILASFERGEWQSVPRLKSEITRYTSIASASLVVGSRVIMCLFAAGHYFERAS